MKTTLAFISALVLAGALSQALAQPDPAGTGDGSMTNRPPMPPEMTNTPPPPPTNTPPPRFTNAPPSWWTNVPAGPAGTNFWWTNLPPRFHTNLPPVFTNTRPRLDPPVRPLPGTRPGAQRPELPADVQALIAKFRTDSAALASQLKTATDTERAAILAQLEALRAQLRAEMIKLRGQALDQAKGMRDRAPSIGHLIGGAAGTQPAQGTTKPTSNPGR